MTERVKTVAEAMGIEDLLRKTGPIRPTLLLQRLTNEEFVEQAKETIPTLNTPCLVVAQYGEGMSWEGYNLELWTGRPDYMDRTAESGELLTSTWVADRSYKVNELIARVAKISYNAGFCATRDEDVGPVTATVYRVEPWA